VLTHHLPHPPCPPLTWVLQCQQPNEHQVLLVIITIQQLPLRTTCALLLLLLLLLGPSSTAAPCCCCCCCVVAAVLCWLQQHVLVGQGQHTQPTTPTAGLEGLHTARGQRLKGPI
jgi:hypothetical protein